MHVDFKDDENNPYLIFLDEIQSCENAIIALKAFTQENKLYHVIASGSLLGVAIKRQFGGSYPVGYVHQRRKIRTVVLNGSYFLLPTIFLE